MSPETISIIVAVLAIAVAAFAFYRSGQPLTVTGVQEAYTQSQSLAAELTEVATMAVAATEQLKETGVIKTNDQAFNNAFDHINTWFPDLDRKIIANAVEGAYHLYKAGRTVAAVPAVVAELPAIPPATPHVPPSSAPDKPLILGR